MSGARGAWRALARRTPPNWDGDLDSTVGMSLITRPILSPGHQRKQHTLAASQQPARGREHFVRGHEDSGAVGTSSAPILRPLTDWRSFVGARASSSPLPLPVTKECTLRSTVVTPPNCTLVSRSACRPLEVPPQTSPSVSACLRACAAPGRLSRVRPRFSAARAHPSLSCLAVLPCSFSWTHVVRRPGVPSFLVPLEDSSARTAARRSGIRGRHVASGLHNCTLSGRPPHRRPLFFTTSCPT